MHGPPLYPVGSGAKPLIAVTGSQKPYIFDLPHLLSLPEGFEFRFRYRHSWVDHEVQDIVASDSTALSGREVIILFHSQDSRYIIPIRKGTIIGLENLGPMILFRFRVGPFAKIDLDLTNYTYSGTLEEKQNLNALDPARTLFAHARDILGPIDGKEKYDLSQPLPRGWYLREATAPSPSNHWDQDDAVAAWARAVAILHGDRNLLGIPFFYLLGFRTETGETVKPSAIENRFSHSREPIHGFSLKELERYRMRILEWCERPKSAPDPRVRLNCEFQQELLALEGASNLIVGRYDVVEFTFTSRQSGYSEVGLRADNLDKEEQTKQSDITRQSSMRSIDPPPAWADWPTIFAARVPVVVKPKPRKFVIAALACAVGLGLYIFVAPKIGPEHQEWRSSLQVVALGILYFGYQAFAEHLDRFLKLSRGLNKIRGGPKEWIKENGGD